MLQSFRNFFSLKRASSTAAALAAIVGLGIAASPAQAEFEQGEWELRLSGFAENDVNFDGVRGSASGALGYFLSDQFEGGVRQTFNYTDIGVPGHFLSGHTALFVNYHLGDVGGAMQPFVGASIGFQYGDGVEDLFLGGPEVGIKYFFDENWFLFAEVAYLFFFEDVEESDESFDDGEFNYGIGLGVTIPGDA